MEQNEIPPLTVVELKSVSTEEGEVIIKLKAFTPFDADKFKSGIKYHLGLSEIGGEEPEFNR